MTSVPLLLIFSDFSLLLKCRKQSFNDLNTDGGADRSDCGASLAPAAAVGLKKAVFVF